VRDASIIRAMRHSSRLDDGLFQRAVSYILFSVDYTCYTNYNNLPASSVVQSLCRKVCSLTAQIITEFLAFT
jgi:hypothetical protein